MRMAASMRLAAIAFLTTLPIFSLRPYSVPYCWRDGIGEAERKDDDEVEHVVAKGCRSQFSVE